ncbi:receptor-like protein kinase THESEUS 1-like, partial [Trifolium medium]|nr:receptor-like protein kinase THESEUS 1-like [Trifolium medium]
MNTLYFNVYINTDIAIVALDLSSITGALALPYYQDFVSNASSDNTLTVSVGPDTVTGVTKAIMNGLEIMKISNALKSLDGSG